MLIRPSFRSLKRRSFGERVAGVRLRTGTEPSSVRIAVEVQESSILYTVYDFDAKKMLELCTHATGTRLD